MNPGRSTVVSPTAGGGTRWRTRISAMAIGAERASGASCIAALVA